MQSQGISLITPAVVRRKRNIQWAIILDEIVRAFECFVIPIGIFVIAIFLALFMIPWRLPVMGW